MFCLRQLCVGFSLDRNALIIKDLMVLLKFLFLIENDTSSVMLNNLSVAQWDRLRLRVYGLKMIFYTGAHIVLGNMFILEPKER